MNYLYIVLELALIYAVLATSLNLIKGFGGLFSLAHAAFYGIGAYTFAILRLSLGVDFVLALLAAFFVAGASSLVISIPSLRVSGEYLLLATFAVQVLAYSLFLNLGITGGPAGLRNIPEPNILGIDFPSGAPLLLITFVVAGICWYIMFEVARSPFGRVVKAIREDELATASLGKNVLWYKIALFFIGCGFGGLAGGLYASVISFINPDSFVLYVSFTIIIMVLLGGLGNPIGGVVGAVFLVVIEEVLRILLPSTIGAQVAQALFGTILVAVVLLRPEGIVPEHRAGAHGGASTGPDQTAEVGQRRGHAAVERDARGNPVGARKDGNPALRIEGLAKAYGGVQAVEKVSFDVERGEIVAIVGPNGAGKTTVFDLITGVVVRDRGAIRLGETQLDGLAPYLRARSGLGRMFQDARPFSNMTVLDSVLVSFPPAIRENPLVCWLPLDRAGDRRRGQRAREILELIGLSGHAKERAGSLSFGQQKLVAFARLLAQGATVWLLDEPAAGIDPGMREQIRDTITRLRVELGITVIIVEHNMIFLEGLVDRAIFMAEGKVLEDGTVASIMQDPNLNRLYVGGLNA